MGVDPDYRRCGGDSRLLMQWAHDRIGAIGYESFIEGNPIGRWLYEECGYRRVVSLNIDLDKKNPSEEWSRLLYECRPPVIALLWRPPRVEGTEKVSSGPWAVTAETWK